MEHEWEEHTATTFLYSQGFRNKAGMIYHPDKLWPDDKERSAIAYLCNEWDYGYNSPNCF